MLTVQFFFVKDSGPDSQIAGFLGMNTPKTAPNAPL